MNITNKKNIKTIIAVILVIILIGFGIYQSYSLNNAEKDIFLSYKHKIKTHYLNESIDHLSVVSARKHTTINKSSILFFLLLSCKQA